MRAVPRRFRFRQPRHPCDLRHPGAPCLLRHPGAPCLRRRAVPMHLKVQGSAAIVRRIRLRTVATTLPPAGERVRGRQRHMKGRVLPSFITSTSLPRQDLQGRHPSPQAVNHYWVGQLSHRGIESPRCKRHFSER